MTIDTNKNGVRFRNSSLRELNEEWTTTKDDYTEQQKSVVAEVTGIAGKEVIFFLFFLFPFVLVYSTPSVWYAHQCLFL